MKTVLFEWGEYDDRDWEILYIPEDLDLLVMKKDYQETIKQPTYMEEYDFKDWLVANKGCLVNSDIQRIHYRELSNGS